MSQVNLIFHGSLNDFLPRHRRGQPISHSFDGQPSVKDMIESLGVPHPEVATIRVNETSVDFNYLVRDGDQIVVHPYSYDPHNSDLNPLTITPQNPVQFVLDIHLGRLAAYLRMLGFDSLYRNDYEDQELARVSSEEGRILLTRDVGLLKRSIVVHGYFVRSIEPETQIREVIRYYNLLPQVNPFRRCIKCNGILAEVSKDSIRNQLPPNTAQVFAEYRQCLECQQVYWRGSHLERMERLIQELRLERE